MKTYIRLNMYSNSYNPCSYIHGKFGRFEDDFGPEGARVSPHD